MGHVLLLFVVLLMGVIAFHTVCYLLLLLFTLHKLFISVITYHANFPAVFVITMDSSIFTQYHSLSVNFSVSFPICWLIAFCIYDPVSYNIAVYSFVIIAPVGSQICALLAHLFPDKYHVFAIAFLLPFEIICTVLLKS